MSQLMSVINYVTVFSFQFFVGVIYLLKGRVKYKTNLMTGGVKKALLVVFSGIQKNQVGHQNLLLFVGIDSL